MSAAYGGSGAATSTVASAGLAVATSSAGADFGGRSSFAVNPFGALPATRTRPPGSASKDDDAKVDADIMQLAQEATRKRHYKDDVEGEEEDEGSEVEDMTLPKRGKSSRRSPAKSAGKREICHDELHGGGHPNRPRRSAW